MTLFSTVSIKIQKFLEIRIYFSLHTEVDMHVEFYSSNPLALF